MHPQSLKRTPLHAAHAALHARFTAFAGYDMPVQYPLGVLGEHRWTRARAGLFDVSHMGAASLVLDRPSGDADADHRALAAAFETLVPGDIQGLRPGRQRYTLLLNDHGGIIDDLMVARVGAPGSLRLVVNAGTKHNDFDLIATALRGTASLVPTPDYALLALQGPEAAAALAAIAPAATAMSFMQAAILPLGEAQMLVSRSGYTGEDGFELILPADRAVGVWDRLLQDPRVQPIGLGARDSLRLEAGLPLYGHDLDETVSPVEAGLTFALSRRRLEAGDFPGAARIRAELADGPQRVRVALRVEGAPAREGAPIVMDGRTIGRVTSGGFSPSLSAPIALGFVPPTLAAPGTELDVVVRDRAQRAVVTALPFVPHRYARQA